MDTPPVNSFSYPQALAVIAICALAYFLVLNNESPSKQSLNSSLQSLSRERPDDSTAQSTQTQQSAPLFHSGVRRDGRNRLSPANQRHNQYGQRSVELAAANKHVILAAAQKGIDPLQDQQSGEDVFFELEDYPDLDLEEELVGNNEPGDLEDRNSTAPFPNESESLQDFLLRVTSEPITTAQTKLNWSLDDAINAALLYSFQIDELRITTVENFQDIGIQFGNFDTISFFEQSFRDSNQPVGSSFESDGSVGRIEGEEFNFRYGVRQQLLSGGELEIASAFGTRDDNSGVLTPPDQASSQLSLSLSKELLRGSGRSIGLNEVLVARQRAEASKFDNVAQTTELLGEVSDAYWEIFSARASLIAAIENANRANQVWEDLQARKNLDADPNILEQAFVSREQQFIQADTAYGELARAQFELVSLINAPELLANFERIELIPVVQFGEFLPPDIVSRQNTAIHNRPEVQSVVEEIKEAQLTHHFSINQLLPRLTFDANASFDGLSGDRDLSAASRNKFDANATYELGFNFELPLQNRQARFTRRRAELTLAKLSRQWSAAVESVKRDVLVAVQDLETSHSLLERQQTIFRSVQERLNFLEQRRFRIPREGAIPSLQLGQLLDVQEQLANSKADFAEAVANRQRAEFELNRASGILVRPSDNDLDGPGSSRFLLVYRQYIEGDRFYHEHAQQVADNIATVSGRQATWRSNYLHSGGRLSSGFSYPEPQRYVDHHLPAVVETPPVQPIIPATSFGVFDSGFQGAARSGSLASPVGPRQSKFEPGLGVAAAESAPSRLYPLGSQPVQSANQRLIHQDDFKRPRFGQYNNARQQRQRRPPVYPPATSQAVQVSYEQPVLNVNRRQNDPALKQSNSNWKGGWPTRHE